MKILYSYLSGFESSDKDFVQLTVMFVHNWPMGRILCMNLNDVYRNVVNISNPTRANNIHIIVTKQDINVSWLDM